MEERPEKSVEELAQENAELRAELHRIKEREKLVATTAGKGAIRFFLGSKIIDSTSTAFTEWVKRNGLKKLDKCLSGFLRVDYAAIATGLCS